MLIIAALNLPYTAVFESNANGSAAQETQKLSTQSTQSLVKLEPEEPEPKGAELPFDFDAESSDTPGPPPIPGKPTNKIKSPKPSKSIVDERVPVGPLERHNGYNMSSIASSVTVSGATSGKGTPEWRSWDPKNTVELVNNKLEATHFLSSFPRLHDDGDDDVKLEKERLARLNQLKGVGPGPTTPLSTRGIRFMRKRQDSTASHLSVDEQRNEPSDLKFHVDILRSSNRGLFNALDNALELGQVRSYKSVGLLGMDTDVLTPQMKKDISDLLKAEKDCHAVYVTDSQREGHYDQYCKEFLWPTFHCQIPDIPTSKAYEEHSWGDYVSVNQAIADKVVEAYREGDTIWVHDYHLMLVPLMVRRKLPHAAIGFFMHVAFPSSEVFRGLAYRAELLSGVLASNSVAFHIPEYAQHFKMSLARLLAVDITGPGVIETADHDAFITTCPLGIDVTLLDRILDVNNPESAVQQHRRVIRQRWPTQFLIASRDKVDPVRGLPQKLRAFDQFLAENPQWASKVVLVQICNSGANTFHSSGIESIADQINSTYGDIASGVQPVILLKQDIKFEQYLALLSEADGFCVSCLRDGMNLTSHEFIYCNDPERMGPLILSEFTGSASVLGQDSLLINPWNQNQLAQAFKLCVEMPRCERQRRSRALKERVESHPAALWASSLTKHIEQAWQDEFSRECVKPSIKDLEDIYHSVSSDECRVFFLEVEPAFTDEARRMLDEEKGEKVVRVYEHRASNPELTATAAYYNSRLPMVIRELSSDPRNVIYIISTESPDHMERVYRSLPGLGLIAEFGKFIRPKDSEEWIELPTHMDAVWQESMKPWLRLLTERSLASRITVHESSIIVEFSVASEGGGEQRDLSTVGEYVSLLNDHHAREMGVRTKLEGNMLTLYRSNLGVIRKRAFEKVIEGLSNTKIGVLMLANQAFATEADDVIYEWAESLKSSGKTRELVTTVVGKHLSHARCMVEGTNALLNLLLTMKTKEPVGGLRDVSRIPTDK